MLPLCSLIVSVTDSKHDTLNQSRLYVGPPSPTSGKTINQNWFDTLTLVPLHPYIYVFKHILGHIIVTEMDNIVSGSCEANNSISEDVSIFVI